MNMIYTVYETDAAGDRLDNGTEYRWRSDAQAHIESYLLNKGRHGCIDYFDMNYGAQGTEYFLSKKARAQ